MVVSLEERVNRIRSGESSAEEGMARVFQQIQNLNNKLNAYRKVLPREIAISHAKKIDEKVAAGQHVGRLAGVPVSIKDCICIDDPYLGTACGSAMLANYHSPYSATAVKRLQAED